MFDLLNRYYDKLINGIEGIIATCYEYFLSMFAALIEIFPAVPGHDQLSSAIATIPSNAWYFFDVFNLGPAFTIVLTAMAFKFTIRRIPVIG